MKVTVALIIGLVLGYYQNATAGESTVSFGRFGTIALYQEKSHPANVILFVSGDGGWNQGVVDMARALTGMDALVAGIDIVHYLKQLAASSEPCSYPAADFESLSHYLQKRLEFPQYVLPVLIGYSSGATLVYATLAQSPPGTFLGAMSMGFCPDLPLSRPFCKGSGLTMEPGPKGKGINFLPCTHLKEPWVALQGEVDQVCNPEVTRRFASQVASGKLVMLPKVGHGYSVPKNWMPQFREAFRKLSVRQVPGVIPVDADLSDLPLVEVPATGPPRNALAVMITGDGGWAGLDQEIGAGLAAAGIGVVGLNALKYFWTARTPESLGADLDRILRQYLKRWKKDQALLVGYSMGADVMAFGVNHLSKTARDQIRGIALLAPGRQAAFEFHLSTWMGGGGGATYPIQPEVEKMVGPEIICFYGQTETDSLCPLLNTGQVKVVELKGGHHFGGDYDTLIQAIVAQASH
ncbi:AcvB/VirJ family lysyl-phosphatidylglycerol hydrolase [Desulfosarcina sp.]|uniref:AcvB/VirJ family lysyl-phosphatidylglycerol hydrolase n=1 Tax=Desulfosarcina sp. TaxID=2027861 RepID=UPI003564DB5B